MKVPSWLALDRFNQGQGLREIPSPPPTVSKGKGFMEKNLDRIASFLREVLEPEGFVNKKGLLQAIDPRARSFGILLLIITGAFLKGLVSIIGLLVITIVMAIASSVAISALLKRVLPVFIFTIFLTLPSAFNVITPGVVIFTIFNYGGFELYISREGLEGIFILSLRVMAMASLVTLLLLTTGQVTLFRSLQGLPIPKVFVTVMAMGFRYILVLIRVAEDVHMARKARTVKPSTVREGQGWLAGRVWFIMERSMRMVEGVYLAMTARGFTGDVKTMDAFEMKARDYIWIGFAIFVFLLSVQL